MIPIHAPIPEHVRDALAEAARRRDAAIVETPADEWDRNVLDQAIEDMAAQGRPFSINDIRDHLPEVRKALINGAFLRAMNRGVVRQVGFTKSTLPSTHNAKVAVYAPTRHTAPAPTAPAPGETPA